MNGVLGTPPVPAKQQVPLQVGRPVLQLAATRLEYRHSPLQRLNLGEVLLEAVELLELVEAPHGLPRHQQHSEGGQAEQRQVEAALGETRKHLRPHGGTRRLGHQRFHGVVPGGATGSHGGQQITTR